MRMAKNTFGQHLGLAATYVQNSTAVGLAVGDKDAAIHKRQRVRRVHSEDYHQLRIGRDIHMIASPMASRQAPLIPDLRLSAMNLLNRPPRTLPLAKAWTVRMLEITSSATDAALDINPSAAV